MIADDLKSLLDDVILENLEIYVLKNYPFGKENYYGSLPTKFSLEDYKPCPDPLDIDNRAFSFIEQATIDPRFYALNITNFQGPYAIKNLNQNIFTCLDKYIDLDLIAEFNLIKSNVIFAIDPELFQPVFYGIKKISFSESYLHEIPIGLFRNLDLESVDIDNNRFGDVVPDFGFSNISTIKKRFSFHNNQIGDENSLKLKDVLEKLKTERIDIEY